MCLRTLRPRPDKPEEETKAVSSPKPEKAPPTKCRECKQLLDDPDLKIFQGDPADAVCSIVLVLDKKRILACSFSCYNCSVIHRCLVSPWLPSLIYNCLAITSVVVSKSFPDMSEVLTVKRDVKSQL